MHSQYLAQYLLNNHLLTPEQVRDALEAAQGYGVKLGALAMNQGMMDARQVEIVHQLQGRHDKMFGEVAVSEGFLTENQVTQLLKAQKQSALSFGQAIIDRKFMTIKELERVTAEAENNNQLAAHQALGEIDIGKIDFTEIEELKELYSEYVELFLRALTRFMDTAGVIVDIKEPSVRAQNTWLISQSMTGDVSISSAVMISEPVLLEMARRYSKEELARVDALAVDSVAEFLNMTNGLFAMNLSDHNREIDLKPQKCGKNVVPLGNKTVVIHISTGFGTIRLIIASDSIQ